MLLYMLDTNICAYVLNNRPPELRKVFEELSGLMCVSAITFAELSFGAEKSSKRDQNWIALDMLASRLPVLDFSAAAARHYGDIRASLSRAGQIIGPMDLLIGAHARSLGLTIVTNNRREFDRIPGLQTENWLEKPGL